MVDLTGQIVAVLGAGRSGQAAASLARHCGAEVTVYDFRAVEGATQATPETGRETNVDLVVVSPGIKTQGDFVQNFARGSGALWGEVELAFRCYPGTIIGITGTNGKTTTTELVAELVRAAGRSCEPCGNYGIPLSEIVMREAVPEVVALELSSFQLETIVDFAPHVAIWLNFAADHMDRYASLEEYRSAKLRIFENLAADATAVIRAGEGISLSQETLTFEALAGAIPLKSTRLRGTHNQENLNAAYLAVNALFPLEPAAAVDALATYQAPAHRCEFVAAVEGVEFLNDSKATNLHALSSALQALDAPMILLAGGKEKGLDYSPLGPLLTEKVKAVISYGEIGGALAQTFSPFTTTRVTETLAQAVTQAAQLATSGDTVLLSPGTSSFDQFSGYEARGEAFRQAVLSLSKTLIN